VKILGKGGGKREAGREGVSKLIRGGPHGQNEYFGRIHYEERDFTVKR